MAPDERRLSSCLEQGSIGFSTGLNEAPSSYGDFAELARLCEVVHRHGAFYTTHLRDYKFHILQAVEEALNLGRKTGVPVQLSHLQTVGRKNWKRWMRCWTWWSRPGGTAWMWASTPIPIWRDRAT